MTEQTIIQRAAEIRGRCGGTIFAFPIEENNPYSEYVVVVYASNKYFVYPRASDVSLAASGVLTVLDLMKREGLAVDYENDVRFVTGQIQLDAPNVMMRRLKNEGEFKQVPTTQEDIAEGNEETGPLLSARGILKFTYLSMADDNSLKAKQFMSEFFKLLAMRGYGKTAAAIKQEVFKMNKNQAIRWIEQAYERFIKNDMDIFDIFNRLKK